MNIHTHSARKPFKSHLAQTAMTWRVGQSSSEYIFPSFLSTSPCSRVLCWEIPLSLACFDLFAPEKCIHCLAACVRAFDNECNRLLRRLRYNLLWTRSTTVFLFAGFMRKSRSLCPTGKWIQSDSFELSHAFADAGFRNYFCHCVHWLSKWLSCLNFSLGEFRKGKKSKNCWVCAFDFIKL